MLIIDLKLKNKKPLPKVSGCSQLVVELSSLENVTLRLTSMIRLTAFQLGS